MMSLTKAKAVAKAPESFTMEELDDALTVIVEDDRLTEAQVTKLQAKIDPVLRARLNATFATEDGRTSADCLHLSNSGDIVTNEQLCLDCGYLRDIMPLDEWDRLKITDPNGDEAEPDSKEEVAA